MAKGRLKPPGHPCVYCSFAIINHSTSHTWKEPWGSHPIRKIGVSFARSSPSLLPSMDCATHTPGCQMVKVPTRAWWCCPAHGLLAAGGRPSKCFLGSQRKKDSAGFPLTPTIKAFVDIARDVKPGVGKRGHFEKPLESLLSHLFSSWEGSVSRT